MAKKKKESGPGTFLIITLVFFIIATLALGFTTYSFSGDATQAAENEKKAKADKAAADTLNSELRIRMIVNRTANGTQTPEDMESLSGGATQFAAAIAEEQKLLSDKLGAAGMFPTRNAFAWKPDNTPTTPIPAIAVQWSQLYATAENARKAAITAQTTAENNEKAERDRADAAKTTFDKEVADLKAKNAKDVTDNQNSFNNLKVEADKAANNFKNDANKFSEARQALEDEVAALKAKIKDCDEQIAKLKFPSNSDLEARFRNLDLVKVADRMGTITEKNGNFVTVRFEAKVNLLPGQTFVVVAPNVSLAEVIEREKQIDKRHREFASLDSREPFSDNEMIKGTLEVTEVTGTYTARCRITHEVQTIRNPVSKNDQLFNVSLTTVAKEHVAYCGIIDLDGDGLPNNEEFVKILEKNNVVLDAFLDLKKGEIVKRGDGMTLRTKFLVVGTDAPQVGKIAEMMKEAKDKGVQLIDARKFLWLIGVRPPQNAQRPYYAGVNVVGDAPLPKEPEKK